MYDLLVDVGGTNTRCGLCDIQGNVELIKKFKNDEFESLESILQEYIDSQGRQGKVNRAALAVAAPIFGDEVVMTNRGWKFSGQGLGEKLGIPDISIINDFTAIALSVPFLDEDQLLKIGGGDGLCEGNRAVLGPGTGLGVSGLVKSGSEWIAIAGEGGHVTVAPADGLEKAVVSKVYEDYEHVSAERLLSGSGLALMYKAIEVINGKGGEESPENIHSLADDGDESAQNAIEILFSLLGSVAGDLALTLGARGGVYIGGGVALILKEYLLKSGFRDRFINKGRYKEYLDNIPTYLITEDLPAITGLKAYLNGNRVTP